MVNSGGALGGNGTIKPYDTAGGGVIINIASAWGLTLDNSGSARSILNFSSGGLISSATIPIIGNGDANPPRRHRL